MPRDALLDLVTDVEALLAAGAAIATGDERLARHGRRLRALAERVPALAAVTDAVERLTTTTPRHAGRALLDLLLVARQLRASLTLGAAEARALEPIDPSGPWPGLVPGEAIYAVVEILERPRPGPVTAFKELLRGSALPDLRLFDALLAALPRCDDRMAGLIVEKALLAYGAVALAALRQPLDLRGGAVDAARLSGICRIDAAAGSALCRRALARGSEVVRAEALRLLARSEPEAAGREALRLLPSLTRADDRLATLVLLKDSTDDAVLDALLDDVAGAGTNWPSYRALLVHLPHPGTTAALLRLSSAALRQRRVSEEYTGRLLEVLGLRAGAEVTPALVALMRDPDGAPRPAVLEALIAAGDAAGLEAVAALLDHPTHWQAAIRAAWRLPGERRYDLLAPLCAAYFERRSPDRGHGEFVFRLFEEDARGKSPARDWDPRWGELLAAQLHGPNRPEALAALGRLGGAAEALVPALVAALEDEGRSGRQAYAAVLGQLGAAAKAAVPALVRALKDGPVLVRMAAAEALGRLGTTAREAIPRLLEALRTERIDDVRQKTREALTLLLGRKR